jgi:hypothetical protein
VAGRKKVDPIKQREKRAKIAAIGGCVLLLGVGAFEVPKMMKLMKTTPPPPAATAQPGAAVTAGGLPDVTGGLTATPAGNELTDTDLPPVSADGGQLVSFDVFETKDPFRPQVGTVDPGASSLSTTPPASTVAPSPPAGSPPPALIAPVSVIPSTTTPAVSQTVSVSVNGVVSRVGRDGTFPNGKPVFRLVSWTKTGARIGIVGGSYSTGDPTLALEVGKPVTLENTSDGQRYKLLLLSTP